MKPFRYAHPTSIDAAVALLADDGAIAMAGGVDLVHEMKRGIRAPSLVVNLSGIDGLTGIAERNGVVEIGALTPVDLLASDPAIAVHAPLLAQAAREVATPQLRAMGTIAGNILQRPQCWYYRDPDSFCLRKGGTHCHAVAGDNRYHAILGGGPCHIVCPSDLAPALVALDATVTVRGPGAAERTLPIGELFVGPRTDPHNEHVLRHGEVITRVSVESSASAESLFLKARERSAWDFALASVSAVVDRDADGTVTRARIVLGGVAPNAWDAVDAAGSLVGSPLDAAAIARAADLCVHGAR
ncbi:MAG: xanthine dehydrogenase family protein subunit M, partial [Spirochaetaceae bacterium]